MFNPQILLAGKFHHKTFIKTRRNSEVERFAFKKKFKYETQKYNQKNIISSVAKIKNGNKKGFAFFLCKQSQRESSTFNWKKKRLFKNGGRKLEYMRG